jgi:hypothetical protein
MAKKHYAATALLFTTVLFVIFWHYLPVEVAGHRPGNVPMLIFYNAFIAMTVTLVLTLGLIILTRRSYVVEQLTVFKRFRHLLFFDGEARFRHPLQKKRTGHTLVAA